jgi:hypothetical protein
MLRKFITISVIVFISFSFMPMDSQSVGKVTFPLGNVLILSKGEKRFRKVTFNLPVVNGDKIETKKQSRCELTYDDGSVVRVDEQTIYTVEKANLDKKEKVVESRLSIGKLWANIKKLVRGRDSWKLKSPAAVVAVRGTIYRMNAGADSSTQVLVYDGDVEVSPAEAGGAQQGMGVVPGQPRQVEGPVQVQGPREVSLGQWLEIVRAQQQIVIRPDGTYAKSDFSLEEDAKLEWVQWNQERDALLE